MTRNPSVKNTKDLFRVLLSGESLTFFQLSCVANQIFHVMKQIRPSLENQRNRGRIWHFGLSLQETFEQKTQKTNSESSLRRKLDFYSPVLQIYCFMLSIKTWQKKQKKQNFYVPFFFKCRYRYSLLADFC